MISAAAAGMIGCETGHTSAQGVRPTMEDEIFIQEHFTLSNQQQPAASSSSTSPSSSFSNLFLTGPLSCWCVFDGHGGCNAAIYASHYLNYYLTNELQSVTVEQGSEGVGEALKQTFKKLDQAFCEAVRKAKRRGEMGEGETSETSSVPSSALSPPSPLAPVPLNLELMYDTSGTTAVVVLLQHSTRRLWTAHAGDSRAILVHRKNNLSSQTFSYPSASSSSSPSSTHLASPSGLIHISPSPLHDVTMLTYDHKADRVDEVERIRSAGGFVVHRRVMGELAISRALGDPDFKEFGFEFVIAEPEISETQLEGSRDEYLVVACDGLYDVMNNQQIADWIHKQETQIESSQQVHIEANKSDDHHNHSNGRMQSLSADIVAHAIQTLNTRDNVTVILIKFNFPPSARSPFSTSSGSSHPSSLTHLSALDVITTNNSNHMVAFHSHSTQPSPTASESSEASQQEFTAGGNGAGGGEGSAGAGASAGGGEVRAHRLQIHSSHSSSYSSSPPQTPFHLLSSNLSSPGAEGTVSSASSPYPSSFPPFHPPPSVSSSSNSNSSSSTPSASSTPHAFPHRLSFHARQVSNDVNFITPTGSSFTAGSFSSSSAIPIPKLLRKTSSMDEINKIQIHAEPESAQSPATHKRAATSTTTDTTPMSMSMSSSSSSTPSAGAASITTLHAAAATGNSIRVLSPSGSSSNLHTHSSSFDRMRLSGTTSGVIIHPPIHLSGGSSSNLHARSLRYPSLSNISDADDLDHRVPNVHGAESDEEGEEEDETQVEVENKTKQKETEVFLD